MRFARIAALLALKDAAAAAVAMLEEAMPVPQMAVAQHQWDPILVGRRTTHIWTYFI